MQNSSILVVVAWEHGAAIWRNSNGSSDLMQVLSKPESEDASKADNINNDRRVFAREIMMALSRGAIAGAYDGIVIIAGTEFIGALRKCQTSVVTRLLIAEIVAEPAARPGFPANDIDLAQYTLKRGVMQ